MSLPRACAALTFALVLAAAGRAQSRAPPELVHFPSMAVGGVPAGPEIPAFLYRPDGAGPFAAIVLAHPCAGYTFGLHVWGWRLAEWGYLVVAPDSLSPRFRASVCDEPGAVTADMRVADIAGALDYLARRPDVTPGHVGLIGHGDGGSATLRAVQEKFHLAERGLLGAVAYYPACSAARDRGVALPLLILIGERDDWTPAEWCRRLQAAGFARPGLTQVVYYPGAPIIPSTRRWTSTW